MIQIKETLSQGLTREFEVTIPAVEIEKKVNLHLENLGKKVKISGFRPGKVPLPLLKQRYQSEALSKVIEDLVEKGVQQVVKENNLKPALKPKVNLKSFEEGKDLAFEVNMEILPVIKDIKLDNLSFKKYVVDVPAEDVTQVLERLAKQHSHTHPIKTDRKTKKGDVVIIDFEGSIDKKPIQDGAGKGHHLELGSGSFIPGFEDQLIGKDKGAHVTVKVTFPKDYHEESYANKPANFEVTITDIHELHLSKIDDEFAKKNGFESLKQLKEWIEKKLSSDFEAQSFLNTKRQVLDALAERFTFDVPKNMIELEFENIWEQFCREIGVEQDKAANENAQNKSSSKAFEAATGESEETLRKEYKAIAERRVRLGLLIAEIGNRHTITVTPQELSNALMTRAREFPGQEKEVFDYYRQNESAMATLRAPIFENKVVEFILGQSKVTDKSVTPKEFEKFLTQEEEEAEKKILASVKKPKPSSKKKDV